MQEQEGIENIFDDGKYASAARSAIGGMNRIPPTDGVMFGSYG